MPPAHREPAEAWEAQGRSRRQGAQAGAAGMGHRAARQGKGAGRSRGLPALPQAEPPAARQRPLAARRSPQRHSRAFRVSLS